MYNYNKQDLYKMGQIYGYLLDNINGGKHDPYPNSDITPFRYLSMMIFSASHSGTPADLNAAIMDLMDKIPGDQESIDYLYATPVPMDMRQHFMLGRMQWKNLKK